MPREVHLNYMGTDASEYDARRVTSSRHTQEDEAVRALLDRVQPASVLDCPVGTGRWLPHYRDVARVVGIDASPDMLAQAQTKLNDAEAAKTTLIEGSAFDRGVFAEIDPVELVVCVRFLNWIQLADVRLTLDNLDLVAGDKLLIGVTVRPQSWSTGKRLVAKADLAAKNLKRRLKKASLPTYVHDESVILGEFSSRGWTVRHRTPTLETRSRVNNLYVLDKADA